MAAPVYSPTNKVLIFPSLHILPLFIICRHFDDGHFDGYKEIAHCGLDLHLSAAQKYSWACWPSAYYLYDNIYSDLVPIF